MWKSISVAFLALLIFSCDDPANDASLDEQSYPQVSTLSKPTQSAKKAFRAKRSADSTNNDLDSSNFFNTEEYAPIIENSFVSPLREPLSTFSIDVDEASYSNVRRFLNSGSLPPGGAVRIEEMINYFHYHYPQPSVADPFSIQTEMGECPWNQKHRLVHIGLQGKEIPVNNLPPSNLVFLIDVSGSMDEPDKLPLLKSSLKLLVEKLRDEDRVAIVVYAGNAGIVLPSVAGNKKSEIFNAIENLEAGGSTAGGEGIVLAYRIALENFITGGNNRVILATDGDFNVGVSSDDELVRLIEGKRKSGIFLSVLGFGTGNYQDTKMQLLADKGNGNHSFIDNISEAKKVLVKEFGSTLFTIAKDVKIQVEFNPRFVKAYRLIGYENRRLESQDFNNDKKDAGELGSGHTVTALYEVIPQGVKDDFIESVDELKYQVAGKETGIDKEIMTIKLRYKEPQGNSSRLLVQTLNETRALETSASDNFRLAASVAEFGLLLRRSEYQQNASFSQVISLAKSVNENDADGYIAEFINLVKTASMLATK